MVELKKTKVLFEVENSKTQFHDAIKEEHNSVWLEERGFDKTLVVICDGSTDVNTGWKGGAMAHLKKGFMFFC